MQSCAPEDGRKNRPKHAQRLTEEINKFEKYVHLVGCNLRILSKMVFSCKQKKQNFKNIQADTTTALKLRGQSK